MIINEVKADNVQQLLSAAPVEVFGGWKKLELMYEELTPDPETGEARYREVDRHLMCQEFEIEFENDEEKAHELAVMLWTRNPDNTNSNVATVFKKLGPGDTRSFRVELPQRSMCIWCVLRRDPS